MACPLNNERRSRSKRVLSEALSPSELDRNETPKKKINEASDGEYDMSNSSESESEEESSENTALSVTDNISQDMNVGPSEVKLGATGGQKRFNTKMKHKSDPSKVVVHDFKYPIVVEDMGKPDATESLSKYDFDLNKLMQNAQVGNIKMSKKISNKKYILDCQSAKQRESILKLVQLRTPNGFIPIKVKIPEPTTEGCIGPINKLISDSDIQEKIDEHNRLHPKQSISSVERISKFSEGRLVTTSFIKLTFKTASLPKAVTLGCNYYPVEPYQREPLLCTTCFLLGHTKKHCRKKDPLCGRCLDSKHPCGDQECPVEKQSWKCRNCNTKGHSAAWPRCPQRLRLRKALLLQSRQYMPLAAALTIIDGEMAPVDETLSNRNQLFHTIEHKTPLKNPPTKSSQLGFGPGRTTDVSQGRPRGGGGMTWSSHSGAVSARRSFPFSEKGRPVSSIWSPTSVGTSQEIQKTPDFAMTTLLDTINKNNEEMKKQFQSAIQTLQKDTEKKLHSISEKMNDISKQKEQQLRVVENFVKSKKQTANPCEKVALDILDVFRQAAEGNPEGIFAIAKKFSKSGSDISEELKAEISIITQNVNF